MVQDEHDDPMNTEGISTGIHRRIVLFVPSSRVIYQTASNMNEMNEVWKLSPDVVFRDLDGEAVILDLASGTYFGLNEVGTRVWRLLEEGRDATQIVEIVGSEYQADRATIARDVDRLLDELRSRRLIVAVAGADSV